MRSMNMLLLSSALMASITGSLAQEVDWKQVDAAFGRPPAAVAGDVHRYGFPRSDLTVSLDGVAIKPALALGGWIASSRCTVRPWQWVIWSCWKPRSIRS